MFTFQNDAAVVTEPAAVLQKFKVVAPTDPDRVVTIGLVMLTQTDKVRIVTPVDILKFGDEPFHLAS